MAESTSHQPAIREEWRSSLARVIDKHLKVLLDEKSPTVKISELLRMIELHAKGEPQTSETDEFWAHINDLRRRTQAEQEAASHSGNRLIDRTGGTEDEPSADSAAFDN